MKVFIVLALLAILAALAGAGLFMLRRRQAPGGSGDAPRGPDKRMAWALALRVGLSVALFLTILLAYQLGWIRPSGLPLQP
ncbi:MAG TPA: DUF2909 domain-containing protein [Ideonella sp.]|uniref:DUF2909 domain-containing protein n=1 Tax=Ideonella sp. TaxID=1929293 RepID=UPI002E3775E0|nr:DUF2909 domain-containing protein [Ideonella sp.]HEX5686684.1 DUF2909 domain-containing protein [Ideonella sp.]